MIYPITVYGDPVLRKPTAELEPNYPGLEQLVEDMFETMHHADGVGLAAPQIGLAIRLFVVDLTALGEEEPELASFRRAFINPVILDRDGEKVTMEEGCLSIPGLREEVIRFDTVRMKFRDLNGKACEELFTGFPARVIQHEYDHLEGVMFVDYCSPLKKRLLKGKLTDITKGQVSTSYRIKVPKI